MSSHTLASGKMTNNSLSYFLTNKDLSKELREPSKTLAVYLKKLVERGFLIIEDKTKKNFTYKIESEIFINWFNSRYKLKPIKEK